MAKNTNDSRGRSSQGGRGRGAGPGGATRKSGTGLESNHEKVESTTIQLTKPGPDPKPKKGN